MSAKRFFVTFLASAVLCGGTAGAVTLDWEDLTNAQQKKAYLDLEEENKELKDQLARLEEQLRAAGIEPVSSGSSNNASGGGDPYRPAQLIHPDPPKRGRLPSVLPAS